MAENYSNVEQLNDELKKDLKDKLKNMFQFDNEDLDFGIYRIMNYKRKDIEKFIEKELIEEIETEFLRQQKERIKFSEELKKNIYNHLITFFSRYYEDGDFISKRRYGANDKYVIPYNGEEISFYWVNKYQYYVKTTEYFRKYTFTVDVDANNKLTVNFNIVEAEEEKGNNKSTKKKFFVLNKKMLDFNKEKMELNIYFDYRSLTEKEEKEYKNNDEVVSQDEEMSKDKKISQDKINEQIIKKLRENIEQVKGELQEENLKNGLTKLIEKHLCKYTRRNTTDYFIHKNLKGFLERELDFYIKNEFLRLDDLQILEQSGYFDDLKLYLNGVRAFRKIALKIIEFLAQIENFEKKLWEKKKFVINTHYVITLDKIKEYISKQENTSQNIEIDKRLKEELLKSILDEILSNEDQKMEWEQLFGVKVKTEEDLIDEKSTSKGWKRLPVDTKYFSEDFKWKLLAALNENNKLDNILDGILIKSENFQALNLLLNKYKGKIQTIYIDPPFNKENEADYLYKVGYKDATWITMLENRIRLAKDLLNDNGSIFVRCDYNGNMHVRLLMNEIFGEENFRNEITIAKTKEFFKTMKHINKFAEETESLFLFSKTDEMKFNLIYKAKEKPSKNQPFLPNGDKTYSDFRIINGNKVYSPKGRKWGKKQEEIDKLINQGKLIFENNKWWLITYEEPLKDIWIDYQGYSRNWNFKTENSEILLKRVIESTSDKGDIVLDFFLGSGTTTAVAHKLKRKWIGIEMGEHFYDVVLPRMKKVLFYDKSGISKDIKDRYNKNNAGGFFKYHVLEQYEDVLENIEFEKHEKMKELLPEFSDYFIKYMLEWETKKSKTFLNIRITDPFDCKVKIIENYQQKEVPVDLIETFNYLFGLNVIKYKVFEDKENNKKYIIVLGEKEDKKIAVVWRKIKDLQGNINENSEENIIEDFKEDRKIIENHIKDFEPDEICVNGDAIVKGFNSVDSVIRTLMFD